MKLGKIMHLLNQNFTDNVTRVPNRDEMEQLVRRYGKVEVELIITYFIDEYVSSQGPPRFLLRLFEERLRNRDWMANRVAAYEKKLKIQQQHDWTGAAYSQFRDRLAKRGTMSVFHGSDEPLISYLRDQGYPVEPPLTLSIQEFGRWRAGVLRQGESDLVSLKVWLCILRRHPIHVLREKWEKFSQLCDRQLHPYYHPTPASLVEAKAWVENLKEGEHDE